MFTTSQAQSATQQNTIAVFTLWVKDVLTARHLSQIQLFQLAQYTDAKNEIAPGEHYILADKETPEEIIKTIAWKIIAAGGECKVYTAQTPTEMLHCDAVAAKELILQIIEFALTYDDWLIRNDEIPLTTRKAAIVAKTAISLLAEPQKSIELDTLRQRCQQSSYNWNKLMGKLEEEFRQELERRQGITQAASKTEDLKAELLALVKETDPIARARQRAEIASHYRLKIADIEQLSKYLDKGSSTETKQFFTLDEFLSEEEVELKWLIPGLLPVGETIILSGLPKSGKTLLALDAAFGVATGESEFLGEKVKPGRVLLVSVDESPQSTKAKLLKRGFRCGDNMAVMTKWDITQLLELEDKIKEYRPDLVIIDSLRRINAGQSISENSAEFADNIYKLKELLQKYAAAGILIHHSNKNPDAAGVCRLRGSTAIAGAVWGVWQLDHVLKQQGSGKNKRMVYDPSSPNRLLTVIPRDVEGQTLNLEFNPENNSWTTKASVEDGEDATEQKTIEHQILELLTSQSPKGLLGIEIVKALGLPSSGVYKSLSRMVCRKKLTQRQSTRDKRAMVYALPKKDTLPVKISDTESTNFSENTTPQEFSDCGQNREKLNSTEMTSEQSVEDLSTNSPCPQSESLTTQETQLVNGQSTVETTESASGCKTSEVQDVS